MSLGDIIKQSRERKGWNNLREAARHLGIDHSYISRLESGERGTVSNSLAVVFCWKLGITWKQIYPYLENPQLIPIVAIPVIGHIPCGYPTSLEAADLGQTEIRISDVQDQVLGRLFCTIASGECLSNAGIHDGDCIVASCDWTLVHGGIYVLNIGGEMCARQIFLKDGQVTLSSSTDQVDVALEDLKIVGKVVLWGKWQKPLR